MDTNEIEKIYLFLLKSFVRDFCIPTDVRDFCIPMEIIKIRNDEEKRKNRKLWKERRKLLKIKGKAEQRGFYMNFTK